MRLRSPFPWPEPPPESFARLRSGFQSSGTLGRFVHAATPGPICEHKQRQETIIRAIAFALLALSALGGLAAQAVAYTAEAHVAKHFFAEDHEARK